MGVQEVGRLLERVQATAVRLIGGVIRNLIYRFPVRLPNRPRVNWLTTERVAV